MDPNAHFGLLARYDAWATQRLLDAVDALAEGDYRRDTGLHFGSVHRTLNHLLLTTHHVWYPRFAFGESPSLALDFELEPERALLRGRLIDGALQWQRLIAGWPAERFQGMLDYTRNSGERVSLPFVPTLVHVFNHGTHHRGQVTAVLTALGRPAPELDLVRLLQAEARPS